MFSKNKAVSKRRVSYIRNYISSILFLQDNNCSYPVLENFIDHIEKSLSEDFKIRSKIVADDFVNKFIIKNYESILLNSLSLKVSNKHLNDLDVEDKYDLSLLLYQSISNKDSHLSEIGFVYKEKLIYAISDIVYQGEEHCPMYQSIFSFFLNIDDTSLFRKHESNCHEKLKIILQSIQNDLFDIDNIVKNNKVLKHEEMIDFIDDFSDEETWFLSRLEDVKRGDGFSTRKANIVMKAISNNILANSIAENCARLTKSNKRELADNLFNSLRRMEIPPDMKNFLSYLITYDNTSIFSNKFLFLLDKKTVAFLLPKLTEDFKDDSWMTRRLKKFIEN